MVPGAGQENASRDEPQIPAGGLAVTAFVSTVYRLDWRPQTRFFAGLLRSSGPHVGFAAGCQPGVCPPWIGSSILTRIPWQFQVFGSRCCWRIPRTHVAISPIGANQGMSIAKLGAGRRNLLQWCRLVGVRFPAWPNLTFVCSNDGGIRNLGPTG